MRYQAELRRSAQPTAGLRTGNQAAPSGRGFSTTVGGGGDGEIRLPDSEPRITTLRLVFPARQGAFRAMLAQSSNVPFVQFRNVPF